MTLDQSQSEYMKTFESIYLTNEVVGLDRFTITFKSVQNGLTYYHTVLGLYYRRKYGAMGLSRKVDLMDRSGFRRFR